MAVEQEQASEQKTWECFHCGQVLVGRQAAEDHFGLEELELPACVQVLTETEKAVVEDRRHWRTEALRLRDKVDQLEHQISAEKWELRRFGPDVRTLGQAVDAYLDERNRRLSTEAKVRELIMRLQDAGVAWQPLRDENRTEWEILTQGGRLPVVDGCLEGNPTIYGYALTDEEAEQIAEGCFADPVSHVELIDWQPGYAWLAVTQQLANAMRSR